MKNKLYYNWQKIKWKIKTYVAKKETDTEFEKMIIDIMWVEIKLSMWWIFRHKKNILSW